MTGEIEKRDPDAAIAEARAAVEDAKSVAASPSTGATLATRGAADAVETKAKLGAAFSQLATSRKAAVEKIAEAKAAIERKKSELDQMRWELERELEPMLKQMARLTDGIHAVNLYLGRDEDLEELRDGESAPVDTPLILRQMVLAMDEETALLADQGGLDFQDRDVFLEWLLADPEHLAQVIPDAKGVVAFRARHTLVDYTGDALADADKNKANLHTHWLLRNGERLYVMTTDFAVGKLLIPTRRSFTQLFQDHEGNELEPGSDKWLQAEEAADGMTRHYMKVALILQGLVDRTAVFHPLPAGGLNLLGNADYDSGRVVLLEEEEKAIGTGRQPFKDWHAERLALLAVGQRVVGFFPSGHGYGRDETSYTTPKWASNPKSDEVYTIAREDGHSFYFSYTRTDTVDDYDSWGNYRGQRAPKTKGSYRIPKDELHSAAFVPIDAVTVAEMEEYLAARTERHAYKIMFPALQSAIAFKLAEEEAEAPFRALLVRALDELQLTPTAFEDTVKELVTWWKTGNKWHRALNGAPDHERRAVKAIVAEYARRHTPINPAGMKALSAVPGAIVLARRTNDLVAVVPEPRQYPAESVPDNLFVQLHVFTPTGKPGVIKRWQKLTRAQVAKWTILGEDERWASWLLNEARPHLTDPQITELMARVFAIYLRGMGPATVIKYSEDRYYGNRMHVYLPSKMHEEWHSNGATLSQPYWYAHAKVVDGAPVLISHSNTEVKQPHLQYHSWRMERARKVTEGTWKGFPDDTSALIPEPPHTVNYSGEGPATIIFTDSELLEADLRLAATWADTNRAKKRRDSAIAAVGSAIYRAWGPAEKEARHARFIEDFGDESLWEDHAKSQKAAPFPLNQNAGSKPLITLGELVVDKSIDPHGLTVAELLELTGPVPGIPAELLPLRLSIREDA